MEARLRTQFNNRFTEERYHQLLHALESAHPGTIDFRIAETPVFVPASFLQQMTEACEVVVDAILSEDFMQRTNRAVPPERYVPDEQDRPECIAFDFGICEDAAGRLVPQMIEMQAFPTLFAFQVLLDDCFASYAQVPSNYTSYLNGYTRETYLTLLKELLLNGHQEEEVILLEIFPEQQKTRIDFALTADWLGIRTVCLTKLTAAGNELFYEKEGAQQKIKRIYNRLIADDLRQQGDVGPVVDLTRSYDIEWITHPNWFYRVSKFMLPFIRHRFVPETFFLSEAKPMHLKDLASYVLKPLFSFAGKDVLLEVTPEAIDQIKDPLNWVLQKKVKYAAAINTPDGGAKAEIRLFYFWKKGWARPVAVHNLARLSKGAMIGTRYNKDKTWVGGTIAFFEK